jgi:hypothetical protein
MSLSAEVEREVAVTLPDGAVRRYPAGVTGAEVAGDISKSLAKAAFAVTLDGRLSDLSQPIEEDVALAVVTAKDEAPALELIRHDCAHIMARAVQELWPDVGAVIGTDTTINTLITRSAATASGPDGVALLKDTVVALNVTADLTPNYYSGGRTMRFFLSPTGGGALTQNLIPNPYNNFATWVAYATETITSSGTIGAFAILGVTQNHLNKQGTTAYSYQETVRTIVSQVGAATTVEKNYDFTRFPLRANPGERILVRIAAGTDLTVPKVGGYGVMQNNRQN